MNPALGSDVRFTRWVTDVGYLMPFFDGVLFAGAARVFVDLDDYGRRYAPSDENHFRFAGGPGLRIALSKALAARIDVGFSNEDTGIVYLAFDQTF